MLKKTRMHAHEPSSLTRKNLQNKYPIDLPIFFLEIFRDPALQWKYLQHNNLMSELRITRRESIPSPEWLSSEIN